MRATGGGSASIPDTQATDAEVTAAVAAIPSGAAAGTPSLRALGTSGTTAAAGNDSRLSDARTPTGAASGDLAGTHPSPTVTQARGLRETAGPTTLTLGAVADGDFLKRVGSTIVGVSLAIAVAVSVPDTGSSPMIMEWMTQFASFDVASPGLESDAGSVA